MAEAMFDEDAEGGILRFLVSGGECSIPGKRFKSKKKEKCTSFLVSRTSREDFSE